VLLSCAPLSEFAALSARSTAGGARVHHNEKRLLRIATQVRSITIQLFFGIIACILLSFFSSCLAGRGRPARGKEPCGGASVRVHQEPVRSRTVYVVIKCSVSTKSMRICLAFFVRCKQRSMALTILDTEFQFDHAKLTIFFEATRYVQFHQLVREIYKVLHTRRIPNSDCLLFCCFHLNDGCL